VRGWELGIDGQSLAMGVSGLFEPTLPLERHAQLVVSERELRIAL
jgi:hypothetical protein